MGQQEAVATVVQSMEAAAEEPMGETAAGEEGGEWTAALGGSNMGAARGCTQCSREAVREGSSQGSKVAASCSAERVPAEASWGDLSDTQPHSLPGLCVVTAGLNVCAVPIVGRCHHCWGKEHHLCWTTTWLLWTAGNSTQSVTACNCPDSSNQV